MAPQYPCSVCCLRCADGCIECSACNLWVHRACLLMDRDRFEEWSADGLRFFCPKCIQDSSGKYNFTASLNRLSTAVNCRDNQQLSLVADSETLNLLTYDMGLPPLATERPGDVDNTSATLMRALQPVLFETYEPLRVYGDGNCCYRAVSRALYGTEEHHLHIRLLAALEVIQNPQHYDCSTPQCADLLQDRMLVSDHYPEILSSVCNVGSWGEMLHLYAVSAATGVTIESLCPQTLNRDLRPLSRRIVGRGVRSHPPPIAIMWTAMSLPSPLYSFTPNHFVALRPKHTTTAPVIDMTTSPAPSPPPTPSPSQSPTSGSTPSSSRSPRSNQVPTPVSVHDTSGDTFAEWRDEPGIFNVSLPFDEPTPVVEPILQRPMPEEAPPIATTEYKILSGASRKGADVLTDTLGFTYSVKRRTPISTQWRCSLHSKHCLARVLQTGDIFTRGTHEHKHDGVPGVRLQIETRETVKDMARVDRFGKTPRIVESVVRNMDVPSEEIFLPNMNNLQRAANRARAGLRPQHPADLTVELVERFFPPGFLRRDIRHDGQRHIIMATDLQLNHLHEAKSWFVDATFKVVRSPFMQLMSIHSFFRTEEASKQVPLLYALMSRRQKSDYSAVFSAVLDIIGPSPPNVEEIVLDFEQAIWASLKRVLPNASLHGCSFHWSQAVFRKIREVGLYTAYLNQPAIRTFLRHLMGLNHLPADHITPTFEHLAAKCPPNNVKTMEVLQYFRRTWITSSNRPPAAWSAFKRLVRTNNDVEGWHYRLNALTPHASPNMYLLVDILHNEASLLPLQIQLLSQNKLYRRQRKNSLSKEVALRKLWKEYMKEERGLTTEQYLERVSDLIGYAERNN